MVALGPLYGEHAVLCRDHGDEDQPVVHKLSDHADSGPKVRPAANTPIRGGRDEEDARAPRSPDEGIRLQLNNEVYE